MYVWIWSDFQDVLKVFVTHLAGSRVLHLAVHVGRHGEGIVA